LQSGLSAQAWASLQHSVSTHALHSSLASCHASAKIGMSPHDERTAAFTVVAASGLPSPLSAFAGVDSLPHAAVNKEKTDNPTPVNRVIVNSSC